MPNNSKLKEVKAMIKFVAANPKVNAKLMEQIKDDDDCFGYDFDEDHEQCKKCSVLTEVGERREYLWVFCKELCSKGGDEEKAVEKVEPGEEQAGEKPETKIEIKEERRKMTDESKKNEYGHRLGTTAARLDEMLKEGLLLKDAVKELKNSAGKGIRPQRVFNHMKSLKEKGFEVEKLESGQYKIKAKV